MELQHIDPTLVAITAFLSRSPGLLNRGPHSSILSPTCLISSCSIRGPEGPLCWVLVFPTASYSNWLNFLCTELYNNLTSTLLPASVTNRTHSTRPRSRLYPDIPRLDAPVIYTGEFSIVTAWPGSICYIHTDNLYSFIWLQVTISIW